ncbi:hypothetical protein HMPREF9318_02076 [Streptococcus urinalis FB127-CNA-2]|uniref:Uncharacterized protein n=1 Tax=Streptococcus urinalis 2285-97 TaxID=764291 RepID=G5KCG1_9STRE|nr:hypothetical protein [Streptococcus urinalis]EHJ56714.1 hypothetical protein STRUR_1699 [Streptococcus urinalis 2285-97]EKS17199.1 hypothetical protein HMPREF9318_02076 [Streptococcus urinalis FB127-CNA-2]VEF32551.1 Sdn [Streptococcus urinalis]
MIGAISTISQDKVNADENAVIQYGQYKDYYTVIGPSQINKSEFPQLYTTTEKVYKHNGTSKNRVTVSEIFIILI